jgi:hypothetical protein
MTTIFMAYLHLRGLIGPRLSGWQLSASSRKKIGRHDANAAIAPAKVAGFPEKKIVRPVISP